MIQILIFLFSLIFTPIYSSEIFYQDSLNFEYYYHEVPRNVHIIFINEAEEKYQENIKKWIIYCDNQSYNLFIWNKDKIKENKKIFESNNYRLIEKYLNEKKYWISHHIVMYEIINKFGGFYFNASILPPKLLNLDIDLFNIFPKFGLTCIQKDERFCSVRTTHYVYDNLMIISPIKHPIIHKCYSQIYGHIKEFDKKSYQVGVHSPFLSGNLYFNSLYYGPINTFRVEYLKKFNMVKK